MIQWCKNCGAYLGLHAPVRNWKIERNRYLCAECDQHSDKSEDEQKCPAAESGPLDRFPNERYSSS